jgi:putative transposase
MVLAYTMANNMKAEIVEKTIIKAIKRWRLPAGCILHSDRGSQYTAESVGNLLKKNGILQSFSRVGKPGDNGFYNTRRVQKRLGYLSPLEWLNQHTELTLAGVA